MESTGDLEDSIPVWWGQRLTVEGPSEENERGEEAGTAGQPTLE